LSFVRGTAPLAWTVLRAKRRVVSAQRTLFGRRYPLSNGSTATVLGESRRGCWHLIDSSGGLQQLQRPRARARLHGAPYTSLQSSGPHCRRYCFPVPIVDDGKASHAPPQSRRRHPSMVFGSARRQRRETDDVLLLLQLLLTLYGEAAVGRS